MENRALKQARQRLTKATSAIEVLDQCQSYAEFCESWSIFLTNSAGVYNKLVTGARPNAKSRQWLGAKKKHRKTDPLLQYLWQSRNSDEHGLEPVSSLVPGSLSLGVRPGQGGFHLREMVVKGGQVFINTDNPSAVDLRVRPASAKLIRVYDDRSKQWFKPPTSHLGAPIADESPAGVAALALVYLDLMLTEAESLPWLIAS
jgi:hypothetical protein